MPWRRARPAPAAAVPLPPTHEVIVAGWPVQVHTPPSAVDARLVGHIGQHVVAVRPRHRTGPEIVTPAGAGIFLDVFDGKARDIATGDVAFDDRYQTVGGSPLLVLPMLTDPLRALLLEHDVVFLSVHGGGAWVSVAHGDPAGRSAAEQAALQVLALLVPA